MTAAVQIGDVQKAYDVWRMSHIGGRKAFYRFMTTPSVERDEFVALASKRTMMVGQVATVTIIPKV